MTRRDIDREVALATGESLGTIRRRGFSIVDPRDVDFDSEPNDLPAQMVDWDQVQSQPLRRAA